MVKNKNFNLKDRLEENILFQIDMEIKYKSLFNETHLYFQQ